MKVVLDVGKPKPFIYTSYWSNSWSVLSLFPCFKPSILLLLQLSKTMKVILELKVKVWCILLVSWSLFMSLHIIFLKAIDGKIKTWLYNMYVFKWY